MRIRTTIDLGLVVRDRRRVLQLDQRALAAKVGVNRQWVIDLEKGRPGAGIGLVLKAMQVLGLRVELDASEERAPAGPALATVDIDAVIERARGKKS